MILATLSLFLILLHSNENDANDIEKVLIVVGCDGTVGSGLVIDKCGICGGNGESCEVYKGLFRTQSLNHDFHRIVTIPAGAVKINVTENSKSRSYLALRSANPDGVFYINGEITRGVPDRSNAYRAAGTLFRYERPFQTEKGETLLADGPTTEDLDVLLYFQGTNPGVYFQYTMPRSARTGLPDRSHSSLDLNTNAFLDPHSEVNPVLPMRPNHGLINGDRGMSVGSQRIQVPNQRYQNRFFHQPHRFHPNSYNSQFNYPPGFPLRQNSMRGHAGGRRIKAMNSDHYPMRWTNSIDNPATDGLNYISSNPAGDSSNSRREATLINRQNLETVGETMWRTRGYSACSKSCAGGVKSIIILCVKVDTNKEVNPRFCTGPRPRSKVKRCNRQACPAFYHAEEWSECSKSCGFGRRTRTVRCMQLFPRNFTTAVSHKRCRGRRRPTSHERCKIHDCARWVVNDEWSKCNVKCGSGTQRRHAVCKGEDGKVLPDGHCSSRRPENVRPCDAGPCVTRWYVTDWEECSSDCDEGVQRRHVYCLNTRESSGGCPEKFEPNATRTCARRSCGFKWEWFTGKWGPCSSKCGSGVQERKVTCISIHPDGAMRLDRSTDGNAQCDASEKPATQQQCNTQSCGSRWHYTPWTTCSVSCGGGSRTRDVQCLDSDGSFSSLCDFERRPRETERCNTVHCSALTISDPDCEDHLRHCQVVLQARLCSYPYYRNQCCATCSRETNRS